MLVALCNVHVHVHLIQRTPNGETTNEETSDEWHDDYNLTPYSLKSH